MAAGRARTLHARSHADAGGFHRVAQYGETAASSIEVFSRSSERRPTFVMFHGGWWQEGSIDDGGRYAEAIVSLGATHVAVGYPLAPNASLPRIVDAAAASISYLIKHADQLACDPSHIVVGGHSAGAHLAAMLVTERAPEHIRQSITGLMLIGGAFDLTPIAESYVNDRVGMSARDVHELSPVNYLPASRIPVLLRVGELEPSEFHRQSELLQERWSPSATVTRALVPGRDHFDVLDELDSPSGSLLHEVAELLRAPHS